MMSREKSSSTVERECQPMMRKFKTSVCHVSCTRAGQDAESDPMCSSTRMPGS